jgi:hypothetical protein
VLDLLPNEVPNTKLRSSRSQCNHQVFLKLGDLRGIPICRCDTHTKETIQCNIVCIEIFHLSIVSMVTSRVHEVHGILIKLGLNME